MSRPSGTRSTHLSKSRIMSGLQCEKRLWLEVHRPDLKPTLTPSQERVFAMGHQVGEEARRRFPGGRLVTAPFYDMPGALRETRALLNQPDVSHIYEAAFEADRTHVKVDVLSRSDEGAWDLIEVKSTSSLKDEHLTDAAIQWHVAEEAGTSIHGCHLMHLNRECRFPDLSNLFTIEEISDPAREIRDTVPGVIGRMKDVVAQADEPMVRIGTHCTSPYECPFTSHCWKHVPKKSIFTIPRLSSTVKDALASRDIISLDDVPAAELNPAQAAYVEMIRSGTPEIDVPAIRESLAALEFPLYFLDFETCAEPIPRFEDLGPWQGYPFQYSLHVLPRDRSGAEAIHAEYLHEDSSDPREPLAQALCRDIGPAGTLVAYNASFEQRVIAGLAEIVPHLETPLRAMIPRFYDLLAIFREHYRHPGFLGSNSIKAVLPVLVPELSYATLDVSNGDEAQAVWSSLVHRPQAEAAGPQPTFGFEREATLKSLRDYCRLDTLAMVRIFEVLTAL